MFLKYFGVGGVELSWGNSRLRTRFLGGDSSTNGRMTLYDGVWKGVFVQS